MAAVDTNPDNPHTPRKKHIEKLRLARQRKPAEWLPLVTHALRRAAANSGSDAEGSWEGEERKKRESERRSREKMNATKEIKLAAEIVREKGDRRDIVRKIIVERIICHIRNPSHRFSTTSSCGDI